MAGNLRVSMLFEADTGRARSAIAGLRGETDQLGAAVAKAGQGARTGGAGISAAGEASEATASDFLRAVTAAQSLDVVVGKLGASMARIGPATFLPTLAALGDASLGIDEIAADFRQATDEARLYQSVLDQVRAKYDPLFAASQRYEMELRDIAEAERMGALSALGAAQARERAAQAMAPGLRQIGQSAQQANAHLANLGFQANDIFMMMAAGQNPMMLAIQQGTQVSQVFGMMRKEGLALGPAIRSALMGMVSPMSLVTMGVIALGAFAVQALMPISEAAKTAEDAVADLATATDKYATSNDAALRSTEDLRAIFGETATEARKLLAEIAQIEGWKASRKTAEAAKAIKLDLGLNLFVDDFANQKDMLDRLGLNSLDESAWQTVRGIQSAFRSLEASDLLGDTDKRLAQQFASVTALRDQWAAASKMDGNRSSDEDRVLSLLNEQVLALMRQREERAAMARESAKLAIEDARSLGTENTRMGGPTVVDVAKSGDPGKGFQDARDLLAAGREEVELARLKLAYGEQSAEVRAEEARQANAAVEAKIRELGIGRDSLQAQQMRGQEAVRQALAEAARIAAARTAADQMLAQHQQEARIVELTARWGADSLEVAYARAAAERQVYEAQLAAQGYSAELADDLMDAWDAARGVAAINMAAGIAAAAGQAMLLAQNLGISLRNAAAIANVGLTVSDGSVVKPGGTPAKPGGLSFGGVGSVGNLGFSGGLTFGDNPGSGSSVSTPTAGASGVGKGGGGGGAKAEANALAELIQREREQIEALRVLDPVQAEILKNHEALKGATDAEKQSVADLIAERMRLEEVRDRLDQIGETGRNAFQQLLSGATSFGGALAMVLDKLAEMLASDAWDMIWGGGGLNLGGLIGSLFGLAPAKADGGKVTGPGGPRDDNLLHWLSNGEFVVNAAATRNAQPLLEAINAGVPVDRLVDLIGSRRPGFADGGLVGSSAPRAWRVATDSGSAGAGPTSTGAAGGKMQLDIRVSMDRDRNWQAAVRDIATDTSIEVSQVVVDEWSRQALPGRVAEIDSHPRVRG